MAKEATHVPQRTCVGCRQLAPARELVRLIAPDGRPTVAPVRRSGGPTGRGAWFHPRAACVQAAVKARAFGRAFKRAVDLTDPADLAAQVEKARPAR